MVKAYREHREAAKAHEDVDYSAVKIGVKFEIREGARTVGIGTIVERIE